MKRRKRKTSYNFIVWFGLWICSIITFCSMVTEVHNNFDLPDYYFSDEEKVVAQQTPVVRHKKNKRKIVKEVIEPDSISEIIDIEELSDTILLSEKIETLKTDTVKTEPVEHHEDLAVLTSDNLFEQHKYLNDEKTYGTQIQATSRKAKST